MNMCKNVCHFEMPQFTMKAEMKGEYLYRAYKYYQQYHLTTLAVIVSKVIFIQSCMSLLLTSYFTEIREIR